MSIMNRHKFLEKNSGPLVAAILVVVSIGGLIEIAPLFYVENTIEKVEGVRPYTPLELAGRDIYIREGCYSCHSQMVRPLRDEVERYGHYSLAAESMYDHPFQWGSKRTGPDLARVGGKYSDDWHRQHLIDPRSLVPGSVMPPYAFLDGEELDIERIADKMKTNRKVGVPYTDEQIESAAHDLRMQAGSPYAEDYSGFEERWGGVAIPDIPTNKTITEMDALIAYLQVLGTMVDFSTFEIDAPDPDDLSAEIQTDGTEG
ncbi:cytochrome-c oxidase, cbb3-type subunit II [Parvularcula lutaonensis]|uniref:Cytochrome-c oxidase, cbb3-type subunit II n=1 Tax=Parvularcula lutaonensis TaxID=491923 RepID=A0ABV7M937_9PROT|nr:cytochrome-c oxidase, cbb3-type subunit II [Parvularcula lutaonensis]GGY45536.1 cytochrome c oxidase, cbb3-type subunit II [Parvularcula lutaonensis]